MRLHPISPVTEPTQYRAIGVVRGQYVPADPEQLTRGVIRTADGTEIEAVVLGRLLTLMRRHLDLAEPHLWVVYPRTREQDHLHLQMVGVWEPSTLAQDEPQPAGTDCIDDGPAQPAGGPEAAATASADALPEGDDYFSVRGELIYTRPETGDLVIKVRQRPRADGSRPVPFKLQLRGEIPLEHLRHFVSLDLRRQGQQLNLESLEVLEPVAQRGNRGGKGRRGGPEKSGAAGGGTGGGGRPRPPQAGPSRPAAHGKAISRPGR
ncbi:MAG: hypothetical protein WAM11_08750 [Cyanobium sp.]